MNTTVKRLISVFLSLLVAFSPATSYAQTVFLPAPGVMVDGGPIYIPVIFKGLTVHPENPFLFDFIVDTGNSGLKPGTADNPAIQKESDKLAKYFFASLTIPEKNQWVNLSPYEKDRVLPEELGKTEMGRDMLAQDYLLKQVTASLIHPAKELGHAFWSRVYERARQEFGTTDIPVDTFNKVWISADKADVFVNKNTVFVVGSHLKVMLESDYLAAVKAQGQPGSSVSAGNPNDSGSAGLKSQAELTKQIVREIIIPELEKEVNTGKNFANLRQIFHSMILATWYKKHLKDALLSQVYANKAKTNGVEGAWVAQKGADIDPEQIWSRYEEAYKTGVFNFIKEDVDQTTGETIPHKYFSGGLMEMAQANEVARDHVSTREFARRPFDGTGCEIRIVARNATEITGLPTKAQPVKVPVTLTTGYESWDQTTQKTISFASGEVAMALAVKIDGKPAGNIFLTPDYSLPDNPRLTVSNNLSEKGLPTKLAKGESFNVFLNGRNTITIKWDGAKAVVGEYFDLQSRQRDVSVQTSAVIRDKDLTPEAAVVVAGSRIVIGSNLGQEIAAGEVNVSVQKRVGYVHIITTSRDGLAKEVSVEIDRAMNRETVQKFGAALREMNRAIADLRSRPSLEKRTIALDTGVQVEITSSKGEKGIDLVFNFEKAWPDLRRNGKVLLVGYRTDQREENVKMWRGAGNKGFQFSSVPPRADFFVAIQDAAMAPASVVSGYIKEAFAATQTNQERLQNIQAKIEEISRASQYTAEVVQKQGHVLLQFTAKEKTGANFTVMVDKGFRLISMSVAGKEMFRVNPELETLGGGIFSMFPFVNRLKEGKLVRNGKTIDVAKLVSGLSMDGQTGNPIHGIARIAETWKDLTVNMEGGVVIIQASFETTDYPGLAEAFGHSKLTKTFRLEGNTLTTDVRVENMTTEAEAVEQGGYEVYADVGEHPFMVYTPGKTSLQMPGTARVFAVDEQKIPTGALAAVSGSQDFNSPQLIDHRLDHSFAVRANANGVVTSIVSDEGRNVKTTMQMEGMFSAAPGEEAVVHAWGGNETSYLGIGAVEPVPVTANGPNRKGELGGSRALAKGEVRTGRVTMTVEAAQTPTARKTVLIVDDEASLLDLVKDVIAARHPDANVIKAPNGAAAIEIMQKMTPEEKAGVAAVYSDTQMPGADGFKVAEFVAKNMPVEVKYVAKSGNLAEAKQYEGQYKGIFAEQPGRQFDFLAVPQDIGKLMSMEWINKEAAQMPAARKTVLIVDDEASLLDLVNDVIVARHPDANVIKAPNGAAAIEIMQKMTPEEKAGVAAVYSDTQMPGADGFKVAEFVAKNMPVEVKYVAKSGNLVEAKQYESQYKGIFAEQPGRQFDFLAVPQDIGKLMSMEWVNKEAAQLPPGGIDLNANNMTLNQQGDAINFKFDPAVVDQFQKGNFTGIAPVILNITPIQNLTPLLGLGAGQEQPSSV